MISEKPQEDTSVWVSLSLSLCQVMTGFLLTVVYIGRAGWYSLVQSVLEMMVGLCFHDVIADQIKQALIGGEGVGSG